MKYALQIYGQLRTFEKALPTFLNFIDYYNNDYDVFLFIDSTNNKAYIENMSSDCKPNSNYSDENIAKLKNILIEKNIKKIAYITEMNEDEKEYELKLKKNMLEVYNKFCNKYGSGIIINHFSPSLTYRKYLLNKMRIEYENNTNTAYDYVIEYRFDFGTTYTQKYIINETTTPIIFSDCIAIGNPDFINKNAEYGLYYPITSKILFDNNCNIIVEKYKKYENWRGDKFWEKHWIFMPELNQRLYLLENSYTFIEAWWETPCNYGFKLIR